MINARLPKIVLSGRTTRQNQQEQESPNVDKFFNHVGSSFLSYHEPVLLIIDTRIDVPLLTDHQGQPQISGGL
jgi:hypothetical protein